MRKINAYVKKMPWPVLSDEIRKNQVWEVTAEIPVIDGAETLVVTFVANPNYKTPAWRETKPYDFRLALSREKKDYRIIDREGKVTLYLKKVLAGENARFVDVRISQQSEEVLRQFTGRSITINHQLGNLQEMADSFRRQKRIAQSAARGDIMEGDVYDCSPELPDGFLEWVRQDIIDRDRIILYKKGNVRGFCHSCKTPVIAPFGVRFRQDLYADCPNCGADCRCILEKGASWGASYVGSVAAFQKEGDGTIFIRVFEIKRDLKARYPDLARNLNEVWRCALRGNQCRKWNRDQGGGRDTWEEIRNSGLPAPDAIYKNNLPDVVAGTALQYACLPDYIEKNKSTYRGIRYAVCAARYPLMEFLYKKGYTRLIEERVTRIQRCYMNVIRWQKKRLKDCFSIPLRLLSALPPQEWTLDKLERCNRFYERYPQAAQEEVRAAALYKSDELWTGMQFTSLCKMISYLEKQCKNNRERETMMGDCYAGGPIEEYRDYLNECQKLGLDLKDKEILFPPSLKRAHERTMAQVKYQEDQKLQEKMDARKAELSLWSWASPDKGLLIRAAESLEELIAEGKALHHCVAGYADKMAEGSTAIFLIRRREAPDEPYYTLELRKKLVIQCRTLHNRSYDQDPEIKEFVSQWMAEVVCRRGGSREKEERCGVNRKERS